MAASKYRIVLRGRLSERFESAFDGMTLERGPGRTVLVGDVRDQAQLYGLLDRLQEFGIELLAVESAEISDGGSEPAAGLLPEIGPAAIVRLRWPMTGWSGWTVPLAPLTMRASGDAAKMGRCLAERPADGQDRIGYEPCLAWLSVIRAASLAGSRTRGRQGGADLERKPAGRGRGHAFDGDRGLFNRQDTAEDAWRVVDPMLGLVMPAHL